MNNLFKRIAMIAVACVLGSSMVAPSSPALAHNKRPSNVIIIREQPTQVIVVGDLGPSRPGRIARDVQLGKFAKRDERDYSKSVSWQWVNKYNHSEGLYLFVPYYNNGVGSYDLREKKKLGIEEHWFGPNTYAIKANGTGKVFELLNNGTVDRNYPN